jgi:hypothetical protein
MGRINARLAAFFTCLTIGCLLSIPFSTAASNSTIDSLPLPETGEIQEITMQVVYDWCGGRDCPDYKMIFQRQGREDYYSSVTKIGLKSGEIKVGDLSRKDFDELAQVIESQTFFDLDPVYPKDAGCADCVITKVTVVRNGLRKKVVYLSIDEMPLQLWTIHRTIEGIESQIQWLTK